MWPNSYRVMWPRWPFLFIRDDTKLYRIKCWYPFTHMGIWWPGEQAYFFSLKPVLYNIIYIFNIFSYLCHIKSVLIFFFSVTTQADCVIFGSCQVLVHTLASELYIHLWVCVTVCVRVCALVRMVQCSFVRNTRHFY